MPPVSFKLSGSVAFSDYLSKFAALFMFRITTYIYVCLLAAWPVAAVAAEPDSSAVALGPDSIVASTPVVADTAAAPMAEVALPKKASLATVWTSHEKKRPWLAAAEIVGGNAALLAFDHYVLKGAYAEVTMHTIRRNLKFTDWFWDSDLFYTNLLEHPYHGGLYHNAARANGMNFWAASLMTTGGSLLWEMAGECELPSVNDFIATSLGGACLGEVCYRLSDLVIDNRRRGFRRVVSEVAAGLLSPMRGLNRVFTGQAWRVAPNGDVDAPDQDLPRPSCDVTLSAGGRFLSLSCRDKQSLSSAYVEVDVRYGDALRASRVPYESFRLNVCAVVGGHQNIFNAVRIGGQLMNFPVAEQSRFGASLALVQHFTYLYTDPVDGGETAYNVSEVTGLGPAFNYLWRGARHRLKGSLAVTGIPLGGLMCDYGDNPFLRTYNMGCGFSLKSHTELDLGRRVRATLRMEYYRLFTWMDYDEMDLTGDPSYRSAQGYAGAAWQLVTTPAIDIRLWRGCGLRAEWNIYNRHTRYRTRERVHSRASDLKLGLFYAF